jgi:superfamily II DNA or RNA helicase
MSPDFALRDWQGKAYQAWKQQHKGIAAVVTGAGKTLFALFCYDQVRRENPECRLLVIVPTLALLDQWIVALQCDLGLPAADIAAFSGDSKPPAPALANVIVLNSARDLTARLTNEGRWMLVVDECHRVGSPENARALRGSFAAVLGLSATPERQYDDGFAQYVVPVLGQIIFRYTYADARRDGVIAAFQLHNIKFDLTSSEAERYEALTVRVRRAAQMARESQDESAKRRLYLLLRRRATISMTAHWRIPTALTALRAQNGKAIVFHERIASAEVLTTLINQGNRRATSYHSQIYGPTRREHLRQFRLGVYDTLVTCRALDEGLNVPDARVALIVASTSSIRQRIQRLGRVLRPADPEKQAAVITLYATEAEQRQLQEEQSVLADVGKVIWYTARRE